MTGLSFRVEQQPHHNLLVVELPDGSPQQGLLGKCEVLAVAAGPFAGACWLELAGHPRPSVHERGTARGA